MDVSAVDRVGPWARSLAMAAPRHHDALRRLYHRWHDWNGALYDGRLREPLFVVGTARPDSEDEPGAWGRAARSRLVAGLTIVFFRVTLFERRHPRLDDAELARPHRRDAFAASVLLHEMVHQWQIEVLEQSGAALETHEGPFQIRAAEIAAHLGLGPIEAPETWPSGTPDGWARFAAVYEAQRAAGASG
ncbi:MAG: hypothetical protein IT305_24955 [Chloroflexi bacterium]|nr:hypothetical protein [Chloroflexota bacterium]